MPGLNPDGFTPKPLENITNEMAAAERSTISPTLDTTPASLVGQINSVTATQLRQVWEVMQAIYASQDPDQATGASLTAIAALTGTIRRAAKPTRVVCSVDIDAGTYAAGSLVAHVVGAPTKRFQNEEEIVSTGGANTATFVAQVNGPTTLNNDTLTVIAESVAGWNSINNPSTGSGVASSVSVGADEETDADLRVRRVTELARRGSSTVDAVRADVLQVEGVSFAAVYENDTSSTDADGRPSHSLEVVVLGGTSQDLVDAIWATKPAGIQAYGTSSGIAVNAHGHEKAVGYSRPTAVPIYIDMDVTAVARNYGGDEGLRQSIVDWAKTSLSVGHDVIHSRLVSLALAYPGVIDAVIRVGTASNPSGTTNVVIAAREFAEVLLENVQVEGQTLLPGVP